MNFIRKHEVESRAGASGFLKRLIRAGLIFGLAVLCYQVFSPFLALMAWALILAVALYPLQQCLAASWGASRALPRALIVVLGIVLIVAPTAILMSSLGDSVHQLVNDVQSDALEIPAPPAIRRRLARGRREGARAMVAGARRSSGARQEHAAEDRRPCKSALASSPSIGVGLLLFLASFIIAGILMAFGEAGSRGSVAIFERVAGPGRAPSSRSWPRRPSVPSHRVSSASLSFRRSLSASAC